MANIKITDLVTLTEPVSTDVLPIVDVSLDVTKKISIAEVLRTAALGSQTDPGISFDGETSGVYSPGANQLAFTTNGSEALRITSDGRVGIGTTDPGSLMEVRNDNSITYDVTDDGGQRDNTATILVTNENGTTNTFSQLVFDTAGTSQSIARIAAIRTDTSTNDLAFVVEGSNVKREALRIRGNGKVGIGTTNPGRNLTVDGGAGTIIAAFQSTGTGCGFGLKDATTSADNTVTIRAIGDDLVSHAGGEERVRITSDGRVGIGTTSPTRKLVVNSTSNSFISVRGPDAGVAGILFGDQVADNPGQISYSNSVDSMQFLTAASEKVRISSDGKVGIGTSTPGAKLDIKGTSGTYPTQIIQHSELDVEGEFLRTSRTDSGVRYHSIVARQSATTTTGNNYIQFKIHDPSGGQTAQNTALHLDGTGNVGIGTTDPQAELQVTGHIYTTEGINFDATDDNYGVYPSGSQTLTFRINNDEKMRIRADGNVGIGTSSPNNLLNVYGGRIEVQTDTSLSATDSSVLNLKTGSTGGSLFTIRAEDTTSDNSNWEIKTNVNEELQFTVGTSEAIRIDSSGNVGIGTTNPDELLHIEGGVAEFKGTNTNAIDVTGGTEQVFKFGIEGQKNAVFGPAGSIVFRQDGSTWSSVGANNKPTRIEFCTQDGTTTDTSETPRLVVDQNGNVGIGTTDPQSALDINAVASTSPFIASINSSEAARIDSDGRLLVGTSSARITGFGIIPKAQIEGANSVTDAAQSIILNRTDSLGPRFILGKSRGNAISSNTIVAENDELGSLYFCGADGTDLSTVGASITANVDGTPGANDMPGRLVFSTTADGSSSPTERMRIKANGSILFADEDESAITAGTSNGKAILSSSIMYSARATTAAASQIIFTNTNGIVGQISTSGSNTAFSTASDYRLKENVVPLANAADRVNQLQVHRFNFIADPETTVDGFLAHEAQAVVPECVTGTKDEVDDEGNPVYQCIDQSKIVPLLTAALQEALAKIETLEQRLTDAGIS